ncbi:hypothetical protein HDV06_005173 [Boothiomyces sp. JEL0866]|nr:hypothetical protein HDV06_005173 [Boothiomyces sp. JEL0866]
MQIYDVKPELLHQNLKMPLDSKQKGNKWRVFTDVNFIILALSGLVFSYLGSRVVNLNRKVVVLEEQIDRYKEIVSKYQEIISVNKVLEEEKPHSKYLRYIPTHPDNPYAPLDLDAHYSYSDFETIFQVIPIHEVLLEDELEVLLDDHDYATDEYYLTNNKLVDEITEKTQAFFRIPDQEAYMRDFCYIKWVSVQIGFGLFARQDILKDQVVGIYAGELNAFSSDTDYEWEYPTKIIDDIKVTLGINGLNYGNYLRFVNHNENANTKAEYVPNDGLWNVVYIATRDILKDEEITTNYGDAYLSRQ